MICRHTAEHLNVIRIASVATTRVRVHVARKFDQVFVGAAVWEMSYLIGTTISPFTHHKSAGILLNFSVVEGGERNRVTILLLLHCSDVKCYQQIVSFV